MQVNQVSTPLTLLQNVKAGIQTGLSTSVKFAGSVGKVFCKPLANAFHGNTTTLTARTGAQGNPGNRLKGDALTRAQCKDLTKKIQDNMKEKNAGAKLMHARILPTLLPRMQTLAKTSQEDFNAYQKLVETAGKDGLLDRDMAAKVMDTQRQKPAETLGLLKAVSEFAGMAGIQGPQLKADMLEQIRSHLTDDAIPNGNPGLDLEPELEAYNNAQGEKKATARDKLFKKAWDQSVSRMETDLKSTKPKTAQEKALKKSLLSKLKKQGPDSITERDLAKMGQLPGTSKSLLNTALLARYAYKEGNIKTTTYTPEEIKQVVKREIKDALENDKAALKSYENLSKGEKTAHDVSSVAAAFRKKDAIASDEKLIYLKNKLQTKIDDFLPPSGNDPWINKMNRAIREGVKKDLFIAPERLNYEMIKDGYEAIGQGGGNAIVFKTKSKQEMVEYTAKKQPLKYQTLTRQLEALTQHVNQSQSFVFKVFLPDVNGSFEYAEGEMELSKQLEHPNIIKTHFAIHHRAEETRIGMVMDYCERGDFKKVLKEDPQYDPNTLNGVKNIAKIILGAVEGLHHMHQLGYVHRDMKLENIFITKDHSPKIGDFGLAKKLKTEINGHNFENVRELKDTDTGTKRLGTLGYKPPEVHGIHHAAPTLDTFSLGATALQAMFKGDEATILGTTEGEKATMDAKLSNPATLAEQTRVWLNNGVFQTDAGIKMKQFIEKSMDVSPENRISYDESVTLLNEIINLKPKKSEG